MDIDPFRLEKAKKLRDSGKQPYAASFERTHTLGEAKGLTDGMVAHVAGRLMLMRDMGKLTFATLQDHTDRLQICFKQDTLGKDAYKELLHLLDRGDFIGVHGEKFTTQKGEPTLLIKEWVMLTKSLNQPPEKWHGIADQEISWRQRYLDMLSNRETLERFEARSKFLRLLREFYWKNQFIEVETPVLVNAASGALATPFRTHHEAYDLDVFLRIAPETFLKECLIGGFDRVFEVARVFRNEGLDPSHLQDFTMVEHYAAYWDYKKNIEFTEQMLSTLITELTGSTLVSIPDRDGNLVQVDFRAPWPRISIRDAIKKASGIDFMDFDSPSALAKEIKSKKIQLDVAIDQLGFGNLIDQLYKKVARPDIVQPTFLIEHPIELSPLARRNDHSDKITDRFQLVVGGWEIVNAYSELVDPVDQNERFEAQAKAHAGGDADAHRKDDSYVQALSYGCPPCSGWGMGVDRIVALITQQMNLRDVVLFPLMKPLEEHPAHASELKKKDPKASAATPAAVSKAPVAKIMPPVAPITNTKKEAPMPLPVDQPLPNPPPAAPATAKAQPPAASKIAGPGTPMTMKKSTFASEEQTPTFEFVPSRPVEKAEKSKEPLQKPKSNLKRRMEPSPTDVATPAIAEALGLPPSEPKPAPIPPKPVEQPTPTPPIVAPTPPPPAAALEIKKAPVIPALTEDKDHLLMEHAQYGHLLPAAQSLMEDNTAQTKPHLIATGAAMEALAKKFGGDAKTWKVAGMLHDLDWDKLDKDWEEHCGTTLEQMLASIQAPPELIGDIRAHYAMKFGDQYPLDSMLRKCLYCVDELTGFIIAVAKVRPSKKLADVEVSSVTKKLKTKEFAAQVDRSQIQKCEELLGVPLDEFIQITLDAMKPVADQLGL